MWLVSGDKEIPMEFESVQESQSQYSQRILGSPQLAKSQRAENQPPSAPSTTVTNGPAFGWLSQLWSPLKCPVTVDICAL